MGMYTEVYVNVDLLQDTPESVLRVLASHGAAKSGSVGLFRSMSYYTPNTSVCRLTFDHNVSRWSFIGKGDLKNYCGEIEAFFAFIRPYVDAEDGAFIGYTRYEEHVEPTIIYK